MNPTEAIDILYAEDERDIRDLVSFTLKFAGYSVLAVTNGEEVVEILNSHSVLPKLLLLDVRMPRMTGYEVCRFMKDTPELRHIPVVFLSAKNLEAEIQYGLYVGGEEYLTKPMSPDGLISRINTVMRKFRLGLYDDND